MAEKGEGVTVLGIFAADATYRIERMPRMGETVLGRSFSLGPGGKGSNQAVAAARLGATTRMVTKLGDDTFADLAEATWREAGVSSHAVRDGSLATGSAGILVNDASGDNVVIVVPGAGGALDGSDVERAHTAFTEAKVVLTQLEQPLAAARAALAAARDAGRTTILNPAPAGAIDDGLLALCDWVTPNETEASALSGVEVADEASAEAAARALMERGARGVVVTLGEAGALIVDQDGSRRVPAFDAGRVVETTGAGDAFNGGLAVALSEGLSIDDAARFGCAVAGISVTRAGAASSMPTREEVDALLARSGRG